MKSFDQKWRECAARAREQKPEAETMPFGFADRVMSRCHQPEPVSLGQERLWLLFGLRTLAVVSSILLLFTVIQFSINSRSLPLRPQIERSIVDYSGIL